MRSSGGAYAPLGRADTPDMERRAIEARDSEVEKELEQVRRSIAEHEAALKEEEEEQTSDSLQRRQQNQQSPSERETTQRERPKVFSDSDPHPRSQTVTEFASESDASASAEDAMLLHRREDEEQEAPEESEATAAGPATPPAPADAGSPQDIVGRPPAAPASLLELCASDNVSPPKLAAVLGALPSDAARAEAMLAKDEDGETPLHALSPNEKALCSCWWAIKTRHRLV